MSRDAPVRVFVDAGNLKPGQAGIRTYTLGVLGALAARPDLHLVVATSVPDELAALDVEIVRLSPRTRNYAYRSLWREVALGRLVERAGADVLFAPVPELPFRRPPCPAVMVVHDVGALVAPSLYGRARWLRFRLALPLACARADAVVCVSAATLGDLRASVSVVESKLVVIGEAPQAWEAPDAESRAGQGSYVLYVGSLHRHKNLATLLRAFAHDGHSGRARLLLAGPNEPSERRRLQRLAVELGIHEKVLFAGWTQKAELRRLYSGALVVALPSLHEGYGLTVGEAMSVGAPVVASDIPALREVGGDAVLYVSPPDSPSAWSDALATVETDAALREDMRSRGLARASASSWTAVGEKFAAVFRQVCG